MNNAIQTVPYYTDQNLTFEAIGLMTILLNTSITDLDVNRLCEQFVMSKLRIEKALNLLIEHNYINLTNKMIDDRVVTLLTINRFLSIRVYNINNIYINNINNKENENLEENIIKHMENKKKESLRGKREGDVFIQDELDILFEGLWITFPNKVGKKRAKRCFNAIYVKMCGKNLEKMIALTKRMMMALETQITDKISRRKAGKWIENWPMFSSWLNGERWMDEFDSTELSGLDGSQGGKSAFDMAMENDD